MTIQHRLITDAERHEPKGITTALAGTVYVANGDTLSGTWEAAPVPGQATSLQGQILRADGLGQVLFKHSPEGWELSSHSGAEQNFPVTPTQLLINGTGLSTIDTYLPYQIRFTGQLWDTVTNKITPITVGDSYVGRIDLPVTGKTGSPTELTIQLDIGALAAPDIVVNRAYVNTSKSGNYTISFNFNIFCLATFLANGGRFFLSTDAGSLDITDPQIFISRTTSGDF